MRYYIITGEPSGDLHGAHLIEHLKKLDAHAQIRAWGGQHLRNTNAYIFKDIKDLAFMGFWEVLMNIQKILKNFRLCKRDILSYNPHALILVDYPGFNLRIAKWGKKHNFPIFYYIGPQVWAWKENRVNTLKKYIDKLFVILPFEQLFYQTRHDYQVEYVGHPLMDSIPTYQLSITFHQKYRIPQSNPTIALLPGSRKQEIRRILPLYLSVAKLNPQWIFLIAKVSSIPLAFYQRICHGSQGIIVDHATYDLLSVAKGALVTSGTATLETALFNVPQVVCYKTSWLSFTMARLLVKLKYISLVNLILEKPFLTELIQKKCNVQSINRHLQQLMDDKHKVYFKEGYELLQQKMGNSGASKKTAQMIYRDLKTKIP
ncbi:MAG: lipid-A-disaccharide synthase [Flavobacteriaceae bacterium]|nr:lipid-A-disaccharide synthase [Flavobacteriaceae bacterium]MCY4267824.1 lipid-A-disaccharide synthase [Flavobacteriaceae bacterium]